jgi:lysozyme family protein
MKLDRRTLVTSVAAGVVDACIVRDIAGAKSPPKSSILNFSFDRELQSILDQAERVLPDAPRSPEQRSVRNVFELTRNLGSLLDRALKKARTRDQDASDLADRIGTVLSQISRANRDGTPDEPRGPAPTLTPQLRAEYRRLFDTCRVSSDHRTEINSAVSRIKSPDYVQRYKDVSTETGVPWYVISALHYREANLNFMGHLHNGNFLKRKTVDVPPNKPDGTWPPEPWDAEQAWRVSAADALTRYRNKNWNLEDMLFMFELYNGWGYRGHPGFRSPYLWNYTQHYERGGYPRDHEWSDSYVSRQCGVVVIIKSLADVMPNEVVIRRST